MCVFVCALLAGDADSKMMLLDDMLDSLCFRCVWNVLGI